MAKVLLTVPDDFLQKIDEHCKGFNFERGEFIRQALREKIYGYRAYKGNIQVKEAVPQEEVQSESGTPKKLGDMVLREKIWEDRNLEDVVVPVSQGWCEGHFDKGKQFKRYLVLCEDENGKTVVDKKWYCKDCLNKVIEKIKREGGVLLSL